MIAAIPILVLAGISVGPLLAKMESASLQRTLGWLFVAALVFAAHFAMQSQPPFLRMVGLCCVLLGGMKCLVYAEWAGSEKLTLPVRSGYGLPTLYFILHGLLTLLEAKWNRPLGKIPALLAVTLPLPWLFPPAFRNQVIAPCIEVFCLLGSVLSD